MPPLLRWGRYVSFYSLSYFSLTSPFPDSDSCAVTVLCILIILWDFLNQKMGDRGTPLQAKTADILPEGKSQFWHGCVHPCHACYSQKEKTARLSGRAITVYAYDRLFGFWSVCLKRIIAENMRISKKKILLFQDLFRYRYRIMICYPCFLRFWFLTAFSWGSAQTVRIWCGYSLFPVIPSCGVSCFPYPWNHLVP